MNPHGTPIKIDGKQYFAPKSPMTGAEIRLLAQPPIGPDQDLYLEVHGQGDDPKIADTQPVDIKPGLMFYGSPREINPGAGHVAA